MLPNRGTWGVITSLIMEASQAPVCIGRKTTGLPPYLTEFLPDFFYNNKNQVRGIRGFKPWPINRSIEPPPPKQRIRHEAFYIAEAMGVSFHKKSNEPYLCLDPLEKVKAELMLHRLKSGNRVVVGLVVETSYALKKWPDPFFAEIIERGTNENINFVLFGLNPFDVAVKNSQHLLNLTGKTSLAQMMAIISQCDFFLSADTGPAHIAQAYGVLTIVLFGPSNEQEFGPADLQFHSLVTPKETLPCRPCVLGPCVLDNSCMNLISVETVYSILQKRIKEIESKIVDHRLSHSQQIQQRIKAAEHCPQVIFEI